MMKGAAETTIQPGRFVELRGRPWLIEQIQGDANDLQTLNTRSMKQ